MRLVLALAAVLVSAYSPVAWSGCYPSVDGFVYDMDGLDADQIVRFDSASFALNPCSPLTSCRSVRSPGNLYDLLACQLIGGDSVMLASQTSTLFGPAPVWSFLNGNRANGLSVATDNGDSWNCPGGIPRRVLIDFPCDKTKIPGVPALVSEGDCSYTFSWPTAYSCSYNSEDQSLLQNFTLPFQPWATRFDTRGNLLIGTAAHSTNKSQYQIFRYTPAFQLIGIWTLEYPVYGIAVNADGDVLYSTFQHNSIVKISGVSGQQLAVYSPSTLSNPIDVAVDSQYIYVANFGSSTVSKLSLTGTLVGDYPVGYSEVRGITSDFNGNLYVSTRTAIVKITNVGKVTELFVVPSLSPPLSMAFYSQFISTGSVIVSDTNNNRVVQLNSETGALETVFNSTFMKSPHGIAIQKGTGNIFIADSATNKILVFKPRSTCTTGAGAFNYDLSLLAPEGRYLSGVDVSRRWQYLWNPCGIIIDPICLKLTSAGAAICALPIPIDNTYYALMLRDQQITWRASDQGAIGVAFDGPKCGRYNFASQITIALVCAATQDVLFIIDDTAALSTSTYCMFLLTLNTPVVCPIKTTSVEESYTQQAESYSIYNATQRN